jgi:hypothetical protein
LQALGQLALLAQGLLGGLAAGGLGLHAALAVLGRLKHLLQLGLHLAPELALTQEAELGYLLRAACWRTDTHREMATDLGGIRLTALVLLLEHRLFKRTQLVAQALLVLHTNRGQHQLQER